ncbi:sensor histidine kinase [Mesorhizobium erdmanii]|uniref:histidine kinase n=1 Tax=Mesorhizobium erdmanii TaxID=1777866 RepID=A0A6M7UI98_9HYPH|nr:MULTISPECIES: ATP-binding protein [Mesorhizobium]OBQ75431.1 two-component sensor histidine kinase [Mesorhizobium loti]QKC76865.1 sensor histidine kinase [Mesorhizobium erdmanii]
MPLLWRRPLLPALLVLLAAAIFLADTITNLEIAVAVFYVAIVLIAVRYLDRRGVAMVAAACMALTVLSFFLTRAGSVPAGVINCAISLVAIAVTAYLALRTATAEATAREAQAQLAHITRVTMLGELTASIAHELNQPLAAIVLNGNAAQRWLAGGNRDEAGKAAERIVRDAERASELIKRLRGLTRKVAGKAVWLDVNQTIVETLPLVQNEAGRNHAALRTELARDLPRIQVDPVQVQQVILNLILNALEAVKDERVRDVTVQTSLGKPGEVVIAVRDSGRGLKGVQLDHVFDAFYTTRPDGMGMGLAISRSIVESHGGRIWAEPTVPHGAIFRFSLPSGRTGLRQPDR